MTYPADEIPSESADFPHPGGDSAWPDPSQAEPSRTGEDESIDGSLVEEVDGLPVLAEVRALTPEPPRALPAFHAAAAAATGFVAGAATIALVRRRSARKLARVRSPARRAPDGLSIVGTRTFLVDVHLVAKPE